MSQHFQIRDLLTDPGRVDAALRQGGSLSIALDETDGLHEHLKSILYGPRTLELARSVAEALARGDGIVISQAMLHELSGKAAANARAEVRALSGEAVSATVVVLVAVAAAIFGFATGTGLDDVLGKGGITVSREGDAVRVFTGSAREAA